MHNSYLDKIGLLQNSPHCAGSLGGVCLFKEVLEKYDVVEVDAMGGFWAGNTLGKDSIVHASA